MCYLDKVVGRREINEVLNKAQKQEVRLVAELRCPQCIMKYAREWCIEEL